MFARMRGPSMKPVCAATKRSAPSEMSVITTSDGPMASDPMRHGPKSDCARTQFRVFPGTGAACTSM